MAFIKHVFIYLPNGNITQYCTKNLGDSYIQVAESITIDVQEKTVDVSYKVDEKEERRTYSGFPFLLETWNDGEVFPTPEWAKKIN